MGDRFRPLFMAYNWGGDPKHVLSGMILQVGPIDPRCFNICALGSRNKLIPPLRTGIPFSGYIEPYYEVDIVNSQGGTAGSKTHT